jgi:large subunit ribosomal protein L2
MTALHPQLGGGEGKASGGQPRSRNGQYSRGLKTRTKGKGSDKLIIQRKNGAKLSKK